MNIPCKKTATGAWATATSFSQSLVMEHSSFCPTEDYQTKSQSFLGLFICITKTIKSMSKTKIQEKMKKC